MLEDAVKMLTSAFCETARCEVPVYPDIFSFHTALLISFMTGKAEVSDKGLALIKPVKREPADCPLPFMGASREEILFFCGVAAQMNLFLRFDRAVSVPSREEMETMTKATQRQLQFVKTRNGLCACGDLGPLNPLFDECAELTPFCIGLTVGAALAPYDTAVFPLSFARSESIDFVLGLLTQHGVTVTNEPENDRVVIKTRRKERLLRKRTPKRAKADIE